MRQTSRHFECGKRCYSAFALRVNFLVPESDKAALGMERAGERRVGAQSNFGYDRSCKIFLNNGLIQR
jgi:hypothetical protein